MTDYRAEENDIKIVYYRPTDTGGARWQLHKQKKDDKNMTKIHFRNEIRILDHYTQYRTECLKTLSKLQSIWDEHRGWIRQLSIGLSYYKKHMQPIHSALYRAPSKMLEFEKNEISKMLEFKITHQAHIERAQTWWASPTVLVTKSDGTFRLWVSYRNRSTGTALDSNPGFLMKGCIHLLQAAAIFSTLHAVSSYLQSRVAEEGKSKTTFALHYGLFRFNHMPFGLKSYHIHVGVRWTSLCLQFYCSFC